MKIVTSNTRAHIKAKLIVKDIKTYFDSTNMMHDLYYRTREYKDFLDVIYKNSTIAKIAEQEDINKSTLRFPKVYKENLKIVLENPLIQDTLILIDKKEKELYPKTQKIRNILIKNDRFSLDFVKPKIESGLLKMLLKLKSIF